jgi:hypothetical protein
MKASKHAANTWLLAHLLHPAVFYICNNNESELIIPMFIGGLICSIPALLLSILFIQIISMLKLNSVANLLIWAALVFSALAINLAGVAMLLGEKDFFIKEWIIFFPSMVAALLAILIRYRQFENLVINQMLQDEN